MGWLDLAKRGAAWGDVVADGLGAAVVTVARPFLAVRTAEPEQAPTVPWQGDLPAGAGALYATALHELGVGPEARARIGTWASARMGAHGYHAPAKNYGALRCLLAHQHGSDGRCVAGAGAGNIFLRCYGSDPEGLRRLIVVARAATGGDVAPLCPQCGRHDAARPSRWNEVHAAWKRRHHGKIDPVVCGDVVPSRIFTYLVKLNPGVDPCGLADYLAGFSFEHVYFVSPEPPDPKVIGGEAPPGAVEVSPDEAARLNRARIRLGDAKVLRRSDVPAIVRPIVAAGAATIEAQRVASELERQAITPLPAKLKAPGGSPADEPLPEDAGLPDAGALAREVFVDELGATLGGRVYDQVQRWGWRFTDDLAGGNDDLAGEGDGGGDPEHGAGSPDDLGVAKSVPKPNPKKYGLKKGSAHGTAKQFGIQAEVKTKSGTWYGTAAQVKRFVAAVRKWKALKRRKLAALKRRKLALRRRKLALARQRQMAQATPGAGMPLDADATFDEGTPLGDEEVLDDGQESADGDTVDLSDDIGNVIDDLKTAWEICSFCRKVGSAIGGVDNGVDDGVDDDGEALSGNAADDVGKFTDAERQQIRAAEATRGALVAAALADRQAPGSAMQVYLERLNPGADTGALRTLLATWRIRDLFLLLPPRPPQLASWADALQAGNVPAAYREWTDIITAGRGSAVPAGYALAPHVTPPFAIGFGAKVVERVAPSAAALSGAPDDVAGAGVLVLVAAASIAATLAAVGIIAKNMVRRVSGFVERMRAAGLDLVPPDAPVPAGAVVLEPTAPEVAQALDEADRKLLVRLVGKGVRLVRLPAQDDAGGIAADDVDGADLGCGAVEPDEQAALRTAWDFAGTLKAGDRVMAQGRPATVITSVFEACGPGSKAHVELRYDGTKYAGRKRDRVDAREVSRLDEDEPSVGGIDTVPRAPHPGVGGYRSLARDHAPNPRALEGVLAEDDGLDGLGGVAGDDLGDVAPDAAASAPDLERDARSVLQPDDLILDVRTPQEFAERHLEGAVNLPVDTLDEKLQALRALVGARRVVVFCAGGLRAARAVHKLRAAGFTACSGHKDPTCGCPPKADASPDVPAAAAASPPPATAATEGERARVEAEQLEATEQKAQEIAGAWSTIEGSIDDPHVDGSVRTMLRAAYDRWVAWWHRWTTGASPDAATLAGCACDVNAARAALEGVPLDDLGGFTRPDLKDDLGAWTSDRQKTRIADIHARVRTHNPVVQDGKARYGAEPEMSEYVSRWENYVREMNALGERADAVFSWISDAELDLANARLDTLLTEWRGLASLIQTRKQRGQINQIEAAIKEAAEKAKAGTATGPKPGQAPTVVKPPDVRPDLQESPATAPPPTPPPDKGGGLKSAFTWGAVGAGVTAAALAALKIATKGVL